MTDPYQDLHLEQNARRALEERLYAIEEYAVNGKDHPERQDDPLFQKILDQARKSEKLSRTEASIARAVVEGYRLGTGLERP